MLPYNCLGFALDVHIDKIQHIQCRAARLVSGIFDWNVRGINVIGRLGWETVREPRDYFKAVLTYRCLKGYAPFYPSHQLTNVQHRYCTRQSLCDLCVPRPNIELLKQCLLYQCPIYGTVLAMLLNVAMISCLLNNCTNKLKLFYDLFMSAFIYACFNWAPRKNTLWPASINVF